MFVCTIQVIFGNLSVSSREVNKIKYLHHSKCSQCSGVHLSKLQPTHTVTKYISELTAVTAVKQSYNSVTTTVTGKHGNTFKAI